MAKTLVFSYIYGLELLKHVCFDTSDAQRVPQGPAVVPQGEPGAPCWVILVAGARRWSHPCSILASKVPPLTKWPFKLTGFTDWTLLTMELNKGPV